MTTCARQSRADPYFAHDPLDVREVTADEMPFVADASHGVLLERLERRAALPISI